MLPEIEQYEKIATEASEEYREAVSQLRHGLAPLPDRTPIDSQVYRIRINAASAVRDAKLDTAWGALKTSENPTVKWIADNCRDWMDEALLALQILPATLTEIKQVAADHDWCEEIWGPFRDKAISEGIVTEGPTAGAWKELRLWFNGGRSYSGNTTVLLEGYVNAIVKAEVEAALAARTETTNETEEQADDAPATVTDDEAQHSTYALDLYEGMSIAPQSTP